LSTRIKRSNYKVIQQSYIEQLQLALEQGYKYKFQEDEIQHEGPQL